MDEDGYSSLSAEIKIKVDKMKKILLALSLLIFLNFFTYPVYAENKSYVTIVHPIRGRDIWQDISSLDDQIDTVVSYNLPATWLLQYKVLEDKEVIGRIKKLSGDHEIGIFLEVDERSADDSFVPYLYGDGDWARSDKVLLSGYMPLERKRMIDQVFNKFHSVFGFYPVSVGAWYIDTFSINYLVEKYNIQAVLEVTDQYQTDTYGLWGKPWGVPYYPAKFNSLVPGTYNNKLNVVKIQWAARDPVRGYGLGIADSTYSIQANDYVGHHGLDISYFTNLANDYLFSENPLMQMTVGIEVGQEGAKYKKDYREQIKYLYDLQNDQKVTVLTMRDFSRVFKTGFPDSSPDYFINGQDIDDPNTAAFWYSTSFYRIGLIKEKNVLKIRDLRLYDGNILYNDTFEKDTNHKLQRIVPAVTDELLTHNSKTLIEGIKKEQIERDKEGIIINIIDDKDISHILRLAQRKVILDGKTILDVTDKTNLKEKLRNSLANLLLSYQLILDHKWRGGVRFSYIDRTYYLGLWLTPSKMFGIKTSWPFVGIFDFSYQVLARFKAVEGLDYFKLATKYFVNHLNHSTIKAVLTL